MNETSFAHSRSPLRAREALRQAQGRESREARDRTAPPCLSRLDGVGGELHNVSTRMVSGKYRREWVHWHELRKGPFTA
jgi:hypothetical protein